MLRHKINLYRYEQGQCSTQRRMERLPLKVQELKNHQGPAHSLLISRFSWDLSLSSIQEGFSFTCVLHSDTNDIFANNTFTVLGIRCHSQQRKGLIHIILASVTSTASCLPEQVQQKN